MSVDLRPDRSSIARQPLIEKGWMRVVVFLIFWILLQFGTGILFASSLLAQLSNDQHLWFIALSSLFTNLLSVGVFRLLVDRQSFASLGFGWHGFQQHAYTGAFAALLVLCAGSLLLLVFGHLNFMGIDFYPQSLLSGLLIMAIVAFAEELLFRGYILNNLMSSFPKWIALGVSALLFALAHAQNPSSNWLPLAEVFVGGVLLGINYIYTKNLWFGILLHFAWNFLQGPVLGYQVSGVETDSLLTQSINGPVWLTGGPFGFEGSVIAMMLNSLMIVVLWRLYERKLGTYSEQP